MKVYYCDGCRKPAGELVQGKLFKVANGIDIEEELVASSRGPLLKETDYKEEPGDFCAVCLAEFFKNLKAGTIKLKSTGGN